ncbi:hypothetical protein BVRB_4g086270 isoform B [Beta vulgaris subsp. vulgaris]|nr:hypothetical protein BVRB_4g086270 isoform B [Beta vulgaris subsp. vulgaris]
MKTSSITTLLFLAVLLFAFGECQLCSYGTVEMERCSIPQCASDCRTKVQHSTGKCIAIDTCCCVARAQTHN